MDNIRKIALEQQNEEMLKVLKHYHHEGLTEEQLDDCNKRIREVLLDHKLIAEDSFPPPPKDPPGGKNP